MSPRREGRASGDGHGDADGGGRHRRRRSGRHGGRDEERHSSKGHDDANEGRRQRRGRSGDHGGRDDGRDSADGYDDADGGKRRRRGRSGDHGGRDDGRDSANGYEDADEGRRRRRGRSGDHGGRDDGRGSDDGYDEAEGGGRRRRGAYRKSRPGGETRSHGGGGSLHPRASAGDVSPDLYDRGHHLKQEQGRKHHHHHRPPKRIREATSSSRALAAGNHKRKRNEHDNEYEDHDLKRPRSRKSEIQQSGEDVTAKTEPRESRKHQTGRQALADGTGKKQHKSREVESPGSVTLSDIERSVVFQGRLVNRTVKGQGSKAEQDKKVDIMYAFDRFGKEKETYKPSSSEWDKGPEKRYPQVHHDRYLPERPDLEQFQLITDRFEPQPESPARFLH